MVKDSHGLKTEGYDLADDADSVLGPVDAAQTRALLRGVGENRDADGNIAFPGRYAYRDNGLPSIESPTSPEAPKQGSSWPTKNEDGSYQLAPGAKLKFTPISDSRVSGHSSALGAVTGTLIGSALSKRTGLPRLDAVGAGIGTFAGEVYEEILKSGMKFPSIEINGGGTSAMDAPDYPNNNRKND